jgi:hypothetical protein
MEQHGNECAKIQDAFSPCQMEIAGRAPDEATCWLLRRPTPDQIQKAHDKLHLAVTEDFDLVDDCNLHAAHDVLAWVLGYECGEAFAANLRAIDELLGILGFVEVDAGAPISEEEAKKRGLV